MGQLIGADASVPVAANYPQHPITDRFNFLTAYPLARSVTPVSGGVNGHSPQTFIETSPRSWAETDIDRFMKTGEVEMDEKTGDKKGPVAIGAAVSAAAAGAPAPAAGDANPRKPETRVAVIGDSDFVANYALNIQGNKDLFLNTLNWLAQQESLIAIRPQGTERSASHAHAGSEPQDDVAGAAHHPGCDLRNRHLHLVAEALNARLSIDTDSARRARRTRGVHLHGGAEEARRDGYGAETEGLYGRVREDRRSPGQGRLGRSDGPEEGQRRLGNHRTHPGARRRDRGRRDHQQPVPAGNCPSRGREPGRCCAVRARQAEARSRVSQGRRQGGHAPVPGRQDGDRRRSLREAAVREARLPGRGLPRLDVQQDDVRPSREVDSQVRAGQSRPGRGDLGQRHRGLRQGRHPVEDHQADRGACRHGRRRRTSSGASRARR